MSPPVDPHRDGVLSPRLRAGDRVRLVSPASYPDRAWLDESIEILTGWGLEVEVGEHALDEWGYMAGRDHERLADLNDAFRDPGVRAIITTRGGAGAYRVADGLDFEAVRRDPKPLVGFSDITYLHLALWKHCRLTSIHGCLAGATAVASVRRLLMSGRDMTLERNATSPTAAVTVPGQASGPLVGGGLRAMGGSVGVHLGSLQGAILFLESPRTIGLGLVDRELTQLRQSGVLDGVAGVALGLFSGFEGYEDRGWTVIDVLRDRLGDLGVPVLGGLDVGHGGVGVDGRSDQTAITIGARALLDADTGVLNVGACVY